MHVPSHGNCYILRRSKVVEVDNLVEIPSEIQVCQAISKLYKNEEHPDKFAYVKFPFGMTDYDGQWRI